MLRIDAEKWLDVKHMSSLKAFLKDYTCVFSRIYFNNRLNGERKQVFPGPARPNTSVRRQSMEEVKIY